jgi:hypothetical protein
MALALDPLEAPPDARLVSGRDAAAFIAHAHPDAISVRF